MDEFVFDAQIDRRGTCSLKFDSARAHGRPDDTLPMWVADMDFRVAPCVEQALRGALDHGIFGYGGPRPSYAQTVAAWFGRRHGWEPDTEWLVTTPGVMFAIAMAIRALTKPGDAVLVQPPVYYPFVEVVRANGRLLVNEPLVFDGARYTVDLESLERTVVERGVRMMLLCSPHNPIGRVWTADELRGVAGICAEHGAVLVCDEIHCDFAFDGHAFTPLLRACPEAGASCVVCTSPSKSFNLGGLQVSNAFVPDEGMRRAVRDEIAACGYHEPNTLGLLACEAAYAHGDGWLDACRAYLRGNLDYLRGYLDEEIPGVELVEPEGTYYAWLDFSGLGLSKARLNSMLVDDARVWLSAGHTFGPAYKQFQRMVLACPRSTLREALQRIARAAERAR